MTQIPDEQWHPGDDMIDEDDGIDDMADECRMLSDGTCLLAGTEFCDWECPYS